MKLAINRYPKGDPNNRRFASWNPITALVCWAMICLLAGCAKQFGTSDGIVKLVIDSIVPVQGAAGQPISIYGSGFSALASANKVYFNGKAATMDTIASYHTLRAFAPAGGTTGNISLAANKDSVKGPVFTYVPAPVITSVLYNGVFIVSGQNFDPVVSVVTVSGQTIPGFGYSASGGLQSLSVGALTLNNQMDNPAPVVVIVRNVASIPYPFLFFPQITNFVADTAHPNTAITIHGQLFGSRSVSSTLKAYMLNGNKLTYLTPNPAIITWTTNTIQATIPNYAAYANSQLIQKYLFIYLEVGVSTKTTSQGLYYSIK